MSLLTVGGRQVVRSAAEGAASALSVCSGILREVSALLEPEWSQQWTPPPSSSGPADPQELECFLDRFFASEGAGSQLRFAAVTVVKDGRLFLEKRYGAPEDSASLAPDAPAAAFAGGGSLTAGMGRLMLEILNILLITGEEARQRVCRKIYRQHFIQHPEIPDTIYAFLETVTHNRRALFHTGGLARRTLIYLLPDQRLGIYLLLGGADERTSFRIRGRLVQKFLDRYYPDGGLAPEYL